MKKTVDVILGGRLLQSYPIIHRGFEAGSAHHPASERDFIQAARRCALDDKLLTEETADEAHFVVRD